jgi:hypothetical protein
MKILKKDLQNAAQEGIISSGQVDDLWSYLNSVREDSPRFNGVNLIYYFGGILVLASMSWFLTKVWRDGISLMLISTAFAIAFLLTAKNLWHKENLKTPAGLLVTAAVGLTPLFVFGFQQHFKLWPVPGVYDYRDYHIYVRYNWIAMEVATVIAAIIALRFYKFPFITFPLAFSLWYLSMDLTPLIFGGDKYSWEERKVVSCVFGIVMLGVAYIVDRKCKDVDFAFWLYLYGLLAFWGGLSSMNSNSELGKFIYCMINIMLIIASVYLHRKAFAVFGALGVMGYISHLAWTVFKDSFMFPIALTVIGILIIIVGVSVQKNKAKVVAVIENLLPTFLLKWRPEERV